jgi:hypothetical protein
VRDITHPRFIHELLDEADQTVHVAPESHPDEPVHDGTDDPPEGRPADDGRPVHDRFGKRTEPGPE